MKVIKTIIEWFGTLAGKIVLLFLTLILLGALAYAGYYAYLDTQSFGAKEYLIDKYDIEDFNYVCTSYIKYEYSDISECDKSWFSECTNDPDLAFKYVFTDKDKTTITVVEDKNGNYTDDFEKVDNVLPELNPEG